MKLINPPGRTPSLESYINPNCKCICYTDASHVKGYSQGANGPLCGCNCSSQITYNSAANADEAYAKSPGW